MSEEYGPSWIKVELMILPSRNGALTIHAISGDREEGKGDTKYIGLDLIQSQLNDKDQEIERLRKILDDIGYDEESGKIIGY